MHITISAPVNWDYKLLDLIQKLNEQKNTKTKVGEVYSSIKKSITGSARSASLIPNDVTTAYAEKYIKKAKSMGLDFNYLVNSSCLGNLEYLPEYRHELVDYLKWIDSTPAKYISVANPFVVDLVKRHTNLKIVLSIVSDPKSVNRVDLLKKDGIDRIVLSTSINRNIPLLKKIRDSTKCKLEVLANESCLNDCPYKTYHYAVSSHDSQQSLKVMSFDYCLIKCSLARLSDLKQIIRSPWIRPDDVAVYDDINIDYLKLSGRIMPTNWIQRAITAYATNKYASNLYDLIDQQKMFSEDFRHFVTAKDFGPLDLQIDNKKLNGFLDQIIKSRVVCGQDCKTCNICAITSKIAITTPKSKTNKHREYLAEVLEKSLRQ
jgi:collagenase-like PrtC family protease